MSDSLLRRSLLKTLTGTLFLAPALRARRLHAANTSPKRLVLLFTPNSAPATFFPTGAGRNFQLTTPMSPLKGMEDKLLFMRRIDHSWKVANHHESGPANAFTGAQTDGEKKGDLMLPHGASIDHLIAEHIHGGTPHKSYHIGLNNRDNSTRGYISYKLTGGKGQPVQAEKDPVKIASQLLGGAPGGNGMPLPPKPALSAEEVKLRRAVDAKILDISHEELQGLRRLLGREEQQRADQHIESVMTLKSELQALPPPGSSNPAPRAPATCSDVAVSGPIDNGGLNSEDAVRNTSRIYADIIMNAFRCDQTRVVSLMHGYSGIHMEGFKGHNQSWHDTVAHKREGAMFDDFLKFWAERVAYLAQGLNGIQDVDGTLLDNTLIVWGFEVGVGHNHNSRDALYLLIGGKNLGIDGGQFLNFPATRTNPALLTAICNAYGLPIKGIGTEPNAGPLPGVLRA